MHNEPELVEATVDKGVAELYEYLKMRQAAEDYLSSHPDVQRVLSNIWQAHPDFQEMFRRNQLTSTTGQIF